MGRLRRVLKVFGLLCGISLTACQSGEQPTFSLLPGEDVFQQNSVIDNKIDIMWVIDNSGSMANLQSKLANNFNSFINRFVTKSFDFKIAVSNTEAWVAPFISDPEMARFRDGDGVHSSGVYYITPDTPDLIDTFITNVTQGISGYGDERPFQSLQTVLASPLNADFHRQGAFLAIIIVTDEDDFSTDSDTYNNEDYDDPEIHPVQKYIDFLDEYTASETNNRRYSVSGITINDADCLAENDPWGNIAERVHALVDATEGITGDVCSDNFAETLDGIQSRINELATQFRIDRPLLPETIQVVVDGEIVPEDEIDGWSFDEDTRILRFHGDAVPAQGAQVVVHYEPVTIK